mgnify:CR=1 FL=1
MLSPVAGGAGCASHRPLLGAWWNIALYLRMLTYEETTCLRAAALAANHTGRTPLGRSMVLLTPILAN